MENFTEYKKKLYDEKSKKEIKKLNEADIEILKKYTLNELSISSLISLILLKETLRKIDDIELIKELQSHGYISEIHDITKKGFEFLDEENTKNKIKELLNNY